MADYNSFDHAKPPPYTTKLNDIEEIMFRGWVTRNRIPFDLKSDISDYDMRGFYKENPTYEHRRGDHFPDTYKAPSHPTFSNESKYALPSAARWRRGMDGKEELFHRESGKVIYRDK